MNILEDLIEYDYWANKRLYVQLWRQNAVREIPQTESLFAHIIAAQTIWCDRMKGIEKEVEVWPKTSLGSAEPEMILNHDRLKKLVANADQLFSYTNSRGDAFENTIEETLHHIVIHGQHHRAQIALLMRQHEMSPPPLDYIFYLRRKKE